MQHVKAAWGTTASGVDEFPHSPSAAVAGYLCHPPNPHIVLRPILISLAHIKLLYSDLTNAMVEVSKPHRDLEITWYLTYKSNTQQDEYKCY